jgi:hypothetical protein
LIIFVASLFLFSQHIFTIFAFARDSSKQPRQQTKKGRPTVMEKGKRTEPVPLPTPSAQTRS